METKAETGLKRQIGLVSTAAIVAGEIIAVGIFLTPAEMARSLGSPMWLLIVWLVMGGMALSGAFCYGELAARFPEAGGGYVYLREVYGPRVAFLYGWKSFLVMDPGVTAALAVGMAGYAGYIAGLSAAGTKAVAVAGITILAAVNIAGLRVGAGLMRWLTFLKIGALISIAVWGVGRELGDWSNLVPFVGQRPGSAPLVGALAAAMVSAFFSFAGWWDVSKVAGEVRDPERTLPRALALGVAVVTFVYIMTSVVFMYLVPVERVVSGETFAAQAGEVLFGQAGGWIFSLIVIVSVLGSLTAILMAAPRVYYAMARDGLFVSSIATVHPRFQTPARAIALQAAVASLLVAIGTFSQIIAYFIFITVFFIALTIAALFVLRRRQGARPAYMTWGYPVTPLIFLALVSVLLFLLLANNPLQALLGVAVVAIGLPVYHLAFHDKEIKK